MFLGQPVKHVQEKIFIPCLHEFIACKVRIPYHQNFSPSFKAVLPFPGFIVLGLIVSEVYLHCSDCRHTDGSAFVLVSVKFFIFLDKFLKIASNCPSLIAGFGEIETSLGRLFFYMDRTSKREKRKLLNEPVGVDVIELPVLFALQAQGIKVVDGQQLMHEVRKIKMQDEITLLNTACMMVDGAYEELYRFMRPGVRENECVGLVSKVLYDLGSEHVEGVNAISGERCSPHPHVYTDRVLRPGDPAFFDILHSYNGYRTCYYRTFTIGSASPAMVDAYKRCRDYMDAAISIVKPGITTADVVKLWPKAEEFGFANEEAAFALQYGHGVGLSIWEKPIFSRLVSLDHPEVIQEGMVFALETYWPASDGWSAARLEEEVVVTKDGCEVITRFPSEKLLVAGTQYFTFSGPLPNTRETQSNLNNPGSLERIRR